MSVTIGFPKNTQLQTSPPANVGMGDTWLMIPAVYAPPFNYQGDPNTIQNLGKDVWIRVTPSQLDSLKIDSGNATLLFSSDSGIVPITSNQDPNLIPVAVEGINTTTVTNNRTADLLILPESTLFAVDPTKVNIPPGTIIPILSNVSPTGMTMAPTGVTTVVLNGVRTIGNTNVNPAQPSNNAGSGINNLIQGQLGGQVRDQSTGWQVFWN